MNVFEKIELMRGRPTEEVVAALTDEGKEELIRWVREVLEPALQKTVEHVLQMGQSLSVTVAPLLAALQGEEDNSVQNN